MIVIHSVGFRLCVGFEFTYNKSWHISYQPHHVFECKDDNSALFCLISVVGKFMWVGPLDTRLVHVKYLVLALVNITLDEMCIVIQTLHPHLLGVFVVCHWTKIKSKHILYLSLLPSLT